MNYITCRNIKRESDTLYIAKDIVKSIRQLVDLVDTWLRDRGCDDTELIDKTNGILRKFYHNELTYNESNSGLFQIITSFDTNKTQYIITFNYSVIGELTYKEMINENKNP